MLKPVNHFVFVFLALLLVSCSGYPPDVEDALRQAGGNRKELEKAIAHYSKHPKDSLKLRAAHFLIANMPYHSGIGVKEPKGYAIISDSLKVFRKRGLSSSQIDELIGRQLGSVSTGHMGSSSKANDLQAVTASFLVREIDMAFASWQKRPWAKDYTFAQFCEYVLPYRIQDEPLKPWRSEVYGQCKWLEDSLRYKKDVKAACEYINNSLMKEFEFMWGLDGMPAFSLVDVCRYRAGVCRQRYPWMLAVMRAFGLPVTIDYGPQWTRHPGDHGLPVLITPDGKAWSFNAGEPTHFSGENILPFPKHYHPVVKVYRRTFSAQPGALLSQYGNREQMPRFFQDSTLVDVTGQYSFPHRTLTLRNLPPVGHPYAYLCSFGNAKNVIPIAWGKVSDGQAIFENLAVESIYLLAYYKEGELMIADNPFIFQADGKVHYLNPKPSSRKVRLLRKYPPNDLIKEYMYAMIDASFQGSNVADFSTFDRLHTIKDTAKGFETVELNAAKPYRYVRYVSSDTGRINMAELSFHSKGNQPLKGKPLSFVPVSDRLKLKLNSKSDSRAAFAFDNDIKTNFVAPVKSWVGLDLGKAQPVGKIGYLYRNDFNVIEANDTYELLYFNKGWHSLGQKKAVANELVYGGVPENAIFLLSNLTKGNNERIFLYRNNRQEWW